MTMPAKYLDMELRISPHGKRPVDTVAIMRTVVLALLPVAAAAVYIFGAGALLLLLSTVASCLAAEAAACRVSGRASSLPDYSAVITGLLLGLTLPPGFPLWMAAVGGFVSIGLGKTLFGGLGFNIFNPALVGRAFLQAAFPVAITSWSPVLSAARFRSLPPGTLTVPFTHPTADAFSGATPLAAMKFDHAAAPLGDLLFGGVPGSMGETCAAVILLCGLYLALRRMLDWRIPAGIFTAVIVTSAMVRLIVPSAPTPGFMLLSGGLMLGAVFMATDMVTSPVTSRGVWLYAGLIGMLVVIIRVWGGLPEGVMYAILIGNAVTPGLNRITQPRVYGTSCRSVK
ncbi:MAG: RnfABCDGE type electron transport complex subunit D [Elusimicrobiota bacterium]